MKVKKTVLYIGIVSTFLFFFCLAAVTYAKSRDVYITFPTVCHQLEKIEDNRVYFLSPSDGTSCIQAAVKKVISLDERYKKVSIYIDGKYSHDEVVDKAFDIDSVRDYLKSADDYRKELEKMELFEKELWRNPEAEQAAKQTADYFYSKEFQEKINSETERLKNELFSDYIKGIDDLKNSKRGTSEQHKILRGLKGGRIYIMISQSVPLNVIRTYAKVISETKINAIFVMRGFVESGHKLMPTFEYIWSILKKDPSCSISMGSSPCPLYDAGVIIDPRLFTTYNIQEVPAIVYVETQDENVSNENVYVVYGDVALDYALDKIASFVENKSKTN